VVVSLVIIKLLQSPIAGPFGLYRHAFWLLFSWTYAQILAKLQMQTTTMVVSKYASIIFGIFMHN
jgi:hypothetical protein